MRILVTGHKGYVGSVIVPMLEREGYEIVGFDNDLYKRSFLNEKPVTIPYLKKDIRDVEAYDLRGYDVVIHLAALSNDPLCKFNPQITYSINYHASLKLARLAKKVGVQRFIYASSCSVYGASNGKMMTEESKTNPVTPYGVSKLRSEDSISKIASKNFSPILLRPATAYGVSPMIRSDLVLNNLVGWAYITGKVLLKSDGSPWRPLIHVEDFSRAFISVLNAPVDLVHNQVFNVGITDENYQMRDLAEIVKDIIPESRIEYVKNAGPDKRNYRANCSKLAQTLPDFKSQWNVRLGAKQLFNEYKQLGLARIEDFEGPLYNRVCQIKELINSGFLDSNLYWRNLQI